MKKWYKLTYVNRRDWILEHFDYLNLSSLEGMLVLLIDYLNANHCDIDYQLLSKKLNLKEEEIDALVSTLVAKNYLAIQVMNQGVQFCLDGLFDTEVNKEKTALNSDLFQVFQREFGRPLSNNEMVKLTDFISNYQSAFILEALKYALMYQKVNMAYIEKILMNWKKDGMTLQQLQEGTIRESK
ncbi:MAG: DnaD domain protein [Erysipelotrichaceae bacterium]|nr:DnaD domain protein [Erysipelotrichaceae bacterium]